MGRKRNKNKAHYSSGGGATRNPGEGHHRRPRKRQRRERFWIEDCKETTPPKRTIDDKWHIVVLKISRAELEDDHFAKDNNNGDYDKKRNNNNRSSQKDPELSDQDDGCSSDDTSLHHNVQQNMQHHIQDQSTDDLANKIELPVEREDTTDHGQNPATSTTRDPTDTSHQDEMKTEEAVAQNSNIHTRPGNEPQADKSFISIRRAPSAKKKPKRFPNTNFAHLPDGDCGDGIKNPYPKSQVADKYWAQRHRLFSRFDQGIQLDRESWYSVTPETIANHIALRMVGFSRHDESSSSDDGSNNLVIMDAFCGAGGNAIALASRPEVGLVVCVDMDVSKLCMAAKNAQIYNVPAEKLLFIHADACAVLSAYKRGNLCSENNVTTNSNDDGNGEKGFEGYRSGGMELLPESIQMVFLSPPWGGMDYQNIGPRSYDLNCVHLENNVNGERLLELAGEAIPECQSVIAAFLPRNTNGFAVGKSALKAGLLGSMELEQNMLNDKFKAVTFYATPK